MNRYELRPDWPWHRVRGELLSRGLTLRQLADAHDLSAKTLAAVNRKPLARAQAVIAAALQLSPLAIWPSRYDPDTGRPLTEAEWLKRQAAAGAA